VVTNTLSARPSDYDLGPHSTFALGVDLGQAIDNTSLAVIERCVFGTGETRPVRGRSPYATSIQNVLRVRYIVRGAELLKLGTNYHDVAAHIALRCAQTQRFGRCTVIFDESGARGTGDIIRSAIPGALAAVLSGGEADNALGGRRYSISKANMVTSLLGAIEAGDLQFAELPDFENVAKQFVDLRRKVSPIGHLSFNARDGSHDDYVTAFGLAWWLVSRDVGQRRMVRFSG